MAAVGRTGTLAFRVAYDAFGEARHLPAKDINGDGKVDKTDTTLAQNASGKALGQLGYNPDADWDRDGKITSADVAQFGSAAYVAALPQGQLAPAASVAAPLSPANARSDFNIGFSGYRFNGDIGAYTVRFRHYDPTPGMCRWLERDPAGYQDGPSLYSYLGRNPMAGTDPYGLALYSVSGDSRAGRAIKRRLAEIDRNKAMARGINGSMCRHPLGSDAQFNDDMRINPDRLEDVVKVGKGIGTAIETTAGVLPGGGFATAVNEASKGNFGAAALNVVPGEKVAGLFVSLLFSKVVLVKFASGERVLEAVEQGARAVLKDGFYEVNGLRFSEYYYSKLWSTGRPAPSLVANEILRSGAHGVPDAIKVGFLRYEALGWEMVYNPVTREVWHLQPIK